MGSPLPQANQRHDAVWQGAKVTALPEGFPLRGERMDTHTSLAGLSGERTEPAGKGLGWGGGSGG